MTADAQPPDAESSLSRLLHADRRTGVEHGSLHKPVHISATLVDENAHGLGRELFAGMRRNVTNAEEGACTWL